MSNNKPGKSTDVVLGCLGSWLLQPGDILLFLSPMKNENHFVNFTGATFALVTHV